MVLYVDPGAGTPVIFMHGSLSDGGYWADQIGPLAGHYPPMAYSRRYNDPNVNPDRPGHCAVGDAQDLAAFIRVPSGGWLSPCNRPFAEATARPGSRHSSTLSSTIPRGGKMAESSRKATLRDGHERDVMMSSGTLFPESSPKTIQHIAAPALLLSGAKSHSFPALVPEEWALPLPHRQNIVLPDAGHQMWCQDPEGSRAEVEAFLAHAGIPDG
jgi:pimeloyl-ACP methyl ester carboxylesterase